ncbi:MAG: hemerythrin [Deltaproteobacteria bacterium HGW-Deltaproteobacteria-8]|jgi:hemerythrin|nr:MAG: hemerythrin [Deltaproteobacteria bacterium HGW-Deltaproteobacteria-8]
MYEKITPRSNPMPYFQWTGSLVIGIKTIDDQHKQLVEMLNNLNDTMEQSGQCPAPELVDRLKTYAAEHFHVEEGYMQAFAYPEFEAHKKEHEAFCDVVLSLGNSCADGSAHPAELLEFLKSWLTNHILDVDMKMGRFLEDHL